MLPKAFKSNPKCKKSPNLVTLITLEIVLGKMIFLCTYVCGNPKNHNIQGQYHCAADVLFEWIVFSVTRLGDLLIEKKIFLVKKRPLNALVNVNVNRETLQYFFGQKKDI